MVEHLQRQYLVPGLFRKAVAVEPAATTAAGLQQVVEIGLRIRRVPQLDDLFQNMWKSLFKKLRVLVWAAFQSLQDCFPTDHCYISPIIWFLHGGAGIAPTAIPRAKRKTGQANASIPAL